MKGYIVRKSQKTIFVRSTATDDEIKFINDTYNKLGWIILPCKANDRRKETATENYVVDEKFEIPYDKAKKAHIMEYAKKYLSPEEYTEFIKASFIVKVDDKGNKKPSYRHIKAKDFIFKTKFADRFKEIEARRNKKTSKKKELEEADKDILKILGV